MAKSFRIGLAGLLLLSGCLDGPRTGKSGGKGQLKQLGSEKVVATVKEEAGAESAAVLVDSNLSQEIRVSEESPVAGTAVTFPPGSLAVAMEVKIEEAVDISNANTAATLGVTDAISVAGQAVAVSSSVAIDTVTPFQVELPLPAAAGLTAGDHTNLVVLYKVFRASDNTTIFGLLPRSELVVRDGLVVFGTNYFGAYQTAYTKIVVAEKIEQKTESAIVTKAAAKSLPAITVTARSQFVVRGGDIMEVTGSNFRPTMVLALAGKTVGQLKIVSDSKASFVVPAGVTAGLALLSADQDGVAAQVSLYYGGSDLGAPVITEEPSEVCAGKKYYDINGVLQTGSKNCAGPSACKANGEIGCVTTSTFKAADLSALTPANILSGVTVAGVTGTGGTIALCSRDNETGCKTTASFPSVDKSVLTSSVLKSGVTVAGVTGQYPSSSVPLAGADNTPDLNSATFDAKIKSSANFEFFDSAGVRYVNSGDADIAAANILNTTTIFGTTGSVIPPTIPHPWDVRIGTTVNGVTGKLKTNCRNAVKSSVYNYDGALASIPSTAVNTGSVADWWDTTTDDSQPVPNLQPAGWGPENLCGGTSAVEGDSNVWLDVTTGGCDSPAKECRFRDKISRLEWTETQPTANWAGALINCDGLSWDSQTDWRLPTAKEVADAAIHGMPSAAQANWITSTTMNGLVVTATTISSGSAFVGFYIGKMNATNQAKTITAPSFCVRNADP